MLWGLLQKNGGKSQDEAFFRLVATLGVQSTPEKKRLYAQRTFPRTINRGRLKSEISALVKAMKHKWIEVKEFMETGGLFPVEIKPTPKKNAKGIPYSSLGFLQPQGN